MESSSAVATDGAASAGSSATALSDARRKLWGFCGWSENEGLKNPEDEWLVQRYFL